MKRLLITFFTAFLLLSFVPMASFAQISATGNDYYLRQATDAFENEKDPLKALELINKQLSSSPRNIGALILRSRILADMGNYGNALTDINKALKINQSANGGYSNPYLYWFKAVIYTEMDDNQKALANFRTAYTLAKKEKDENLHGISSAYADLLFSLDRQDEADDIYKAMLKRNDVDQVAIVGRARNMIVKGQSDEALRLLDKCLKLDSSYPEVYRFKTVAHDQLGQTVDAIKSAIRWLELDDTADTDFIIKVMSKRFSYAEANLKSCIKNNEKSLIFLSVLAGLYEDNHKYKEAVKSYDDLEWNVGYFDEICHFRARCYDNLGMYAKAVEDITKVLQNRPIWVYYCERGSYYWHAGDLDKALSDFTSAIYDAPEESFGYYMRGWIYDTLGDTEKAMADYDLGIELDNDYPYLHLMRGELLLSQGKREEAKKDFQAILLNDNEPSGGSCRHYALHFLGWDDEALEWMEKVIASDPDDYGVYYDKACLMARMGRAKESIQALRTALEKGYRSFAHIRNDDDLDPIRNLPAFKALLEEFESKHRSTLEESSTSSPLIEGLITEITMDDSTVSSLGLPLEMDGYLQEKTSVA